MIMDTEAGGGLAICRDARDMGSSHPGATGSRAHLRVGLAGVLVDDGPPEDRDDALGAAAEHAEWRDHLHTPAVLSEALHLALQTILSDNSS